MVGDAGLVLSVHLAQRLHARASAADSKIYNYYFTFDGKWNMMKKFHRIRVPGQQAMASCFQHVSLNMPVSILLADILVSRGGTW